MKYVESNLIRGVSDTKYDKSKYKYLEIIIRYVCLCIVMFSFIYGFFSSFTPSWMFNYKSVSLATFVYAVIANKGKIYSNIIKNQAFKHIFIWECFLLGFVSVVEMFIGKGVGIRLFDNCVDFIIFMPLVLYGFTILFKDKDELMKVLIIISLFQSVIIILGLFSSEFNLFINSNFNYYRQDYIAYNYSEGWNSLADLGYATGISCATSKGCLKLSLGIIACAYYLMKNDEKIKLYYLYFIIITFASTALARSGLVISLIALLFIFSKLRKDNPSKINKLIAISIVLLLMATVLVALLGIGDSLSYVFRRLIKTKNPEVFMHFFQLYFNGKATVIPRLSLKTLIGTGIVSGTSANGVTINADGGFLRMYCGAGLVMCVINYLCLFGTLLKESRKQKIRLNKYVSMLFFAILIYGEFKEYFIYDKYYVFLYILFLMFCIDDNTGKDALAENAIYE